MKWRGDQIKNANLSALFLSSFLTLFLCLSAFLSQAWISSQHSHLKSLGGKSRPLGSLAPWLDNSFLAWRGQRWAVWETGSHWGSRGDVFLEEVGGGGYLVAGWHGANTDSFQIALFLPGPAALLHITLLTGKDQRHSRPGAIKPLTDS